MLQEYEVLWDKDLPQQVEDLLAGKSPFVDSEMALAAGSNIAHASLARNTMGELRFVLVL